MPNEIQAAYDRLSTWYRGLDYSGYDPFDGLNSRIFRATPLYRSRLARLAWTQFFKRSPVSFRGLARVPQERNPKGTALFALAKLEDLRRTGSATDAQEARRLLDDLVRAQLPGFSGAAWGYNFDWQGRAFFAPKGTPTIVPTAFAARALLSGAGVLNDPAYLETAGSVADFILNDLHRPVDTDDEVCFSYTPGDDTRVYNASLLAAETLATISRMTGDQEQAQLAVHAARYVVRRQREDGSWAYGEDDYQGWSDNFHSAFVLCSLYRIAQAIPDANSELLPTIRRGYDFWRERFFLVDGWPKYFPDRLYPADAHSAGAAILTFLELRELDPSAIARAKAVARWAIRNLQSPKGFFYYQRHRFYTNRIPYMRWSQAWMAYALAKLMRQLTIDNDN